MSKIGFPGGSTGGGGGGGDGSGLAPESGLLYLLKDGTRALEGTLLPSTSGTVDLGSESLPYGNFYAMSGFFGSGTTTIDNSGVNAGSITAADEIYLSGVKLAQHISTIASESAVGLSVDGSNRMTGSLNGPVGSAFNIKAFSNAGFDLSDEFDNTSFDTTRWDAFASTSSSVAETTKLRMIAGGGNSRNALIRPVAGAYDKNSNIDVQVHVDPVSAGGSSSTIGVLGLIGNATSNAPGDYETGQHIDFNPSTDSIQAKTSNYNIGIRGSTNNTTTSLILGWAGFSSAGFGTVVGDTAQLAASGGIDLRVTFNVAAGTGQVLVRTPGITEYFGGAWHEVSGGDMTFAENPEVRMGVYRGTDNVTGDYSSFVQTEGTFVLDAGGATTNFVFQNASLVVAGNNLVEFQNNGSGMAHITADGDIHSSGVVAATTQMTISGVNVGDFLSVGGGSVDLTNVSTNITPDTSGLHQIGTRAKPFASGLFDTGIFITGADDGQSPGLVRNGWALKVQALNGNSTNMEANSFLPTSGGSVLWGSRASLKSYTDAALRVEFNDESEFGFLEVSGVRLKAPNGSGWLLKLDNNGILQTSGPFDFNTPV